MPRAVPSGEAVIHHPGSWADPDGFAVNDAGDVLAFVVSHGVIPDDRCLITSPTALLWRGHDGSEKTFGGDITGRHFAEVPGGAFVVGALRHRCAPSSGQHDARGPYLITADGATVRLRWPAGAEGNRARRICAEALDVDRCVFSADARVRLRPPAPKAPNGDMGLRGPGGILTATSADFRTLWWSLDNGATWHHRTTPLAYRHTPVASHRGVSPMLVAGTGNNVVLGFYTDTQIDYTLDSGKTWRVRNLPAPPTGWDQGQVWVTESGILLAIDLSADRASDALTRTTDATWARSEIAQPNAPKVPLWVWVHGDVVNAHNPDVADASRPGPWWISTNAGASWRRNDLLPVTDVTPAP